MIHVGGHVNNVERYAVYLQCGAGSVHQKWLTGSKKSWDLIVNHYDDTHIGSLPSNIEFQQMGEYPGTKMTSFACFLERWESLAFEYDYIMLMDDDVLITEDDVSALFMAAESNNLQLLQASLSEDSACSHDVFRTKGAGIRYVNGVEIMMPIMSRRVLEIIKGIFLESISGWGIDLVAGKFVMDKLGVLPAIIDDVIAIHSKEINLNTGSFYKMLYGANINPIIEMRYLADKYDTEKVFREVS
jgi:hypothetical protein